VAHGVYYLFASKTYLTSLSEGHTLAVYTEATLLVLKVSLITQTDTHLMASFPGQPE